MPDKDWFERNAHRFLVKEWFVYRVHQKGDELVDMNAFVKIVVEAMIFAYNEGLKAGKPAKQARIIRMEG